MDYKTIAEQNSGIIVAEYKRQYNHNRGYQSEKELEDNLIADLQQQGYEYVQFKDTDELLANTKVQIEKLNAVTFTNDEWQRFQVEYLLPANDNKVDATRKIQENYICDFKFDDGKIKNIKIIDKKNINNNYLQVTNQVTQKGEHLNRYDVTILVNGLPLVQIELKKRGVAIKEAFNQIQRYGYESFNIANSLYKYVQIFVISNGTHTRYFANTTARDQSSYDFTCEWADAKNNRISELEDFTATFFDKKTLLEVITKYCVFNASDILMLMRPYQIAATEKILWKIRSSYEAKNYASVNAGGYVWHTTGSGKTLTSFKTARLATELDFIDKVFFVVDRKDLDFQTMKEYQKFQKDSVNGSKDTRELRKSIEKDDNKIVVTTIQKLNEFIKSNPQHEVYKKHCVLIFDECHRSQFGLAQKNIRKNFKYYYQFGFTGTPIFVDNSLTGETTNSVFGQELHSYVITDAIRDNKVLKFKIDYNNIVKEFQSAEEEPEIDKKTLKQIENKLLLHEDRIAKITEHILKVFPKKTHSTERYIDKKQSYTGFNAMFAVQSVEAAKMYYEQFEKQQAQLPENKRLKVATIYSYSANEEQAALGEIEDENFSPNVSSLNSTAKQFLVKVVKDYNDTFQTNYSIDGDSFQDYYKDLTERVKNREVDLLIVVGMFLTGFDAPKLNTLFVDKNLRYHGLIQAFSRTNRILSDVKPFGNIVCFRNLDKAVDDAITLFGKSNSANVIKTRSYDEYINGYTEDSGKMIKGYKEVCEELLRKFPDPFSIERDRDKREFVQIFGEVLQLENILRNFDDFYDENYEDRKELIPEGLMQDLKSLYVDIREEFIIGRRGGDGKREMPDVDISDLVFHVELLRTDEINLDYILDLIYDKTQEHETEEELKAEISRTLRTSLDMRPKEMLVMEFIEETDIKKIKGRENVRDEFYKYAREKKEEEISELVETEKLKDGADTFIKQSVENGYVNSLGTELEKLLPPVSRRGGAKARLKQAVLEKIQKVVDVFVGI